MELTVATVRLPAQLDPGSVATLTRDVDDALRAGPAVIALHGASSDTFCLGLALPNASSSAPQAPSSQTEGAASSRADAPTHAFAELLARLHEAERPLLAVVDGRAIGGGLGIASACDWVLATDRATFALPELVWGLVPAIIWPVIADRMAPHAARRWTISAHARTSAEAHDAGLVDEIVDAASLDRAIRRAARSLARLDPVALRRFRSWSRVSRSGDLTAALTAGADVTAGMMREPSVAARWGAFVEGGAPWSA